MTEGLIIAPFEARDVSDVLRMAREYSSRTIYGKLGFDETSVVQGLVNMLSFNKSIIHTIVARLDERPVAFLMAERTQPWWSGGGRIAIEQYYAVTPDVPPDTADMMLDNFESWAFEDPLTRGVVFQSVPEFGREAAVQRFMERRGYSSGEKSWIMMFNRGQS